MLDWLQTDRKDRHTVAVFFRGRMAPRAHEFASLAGQGIEVTDSPPGPATVWELGLSHPQWGQATLACFRTPPRPPPRDVLLYDLGITREEAEAASGAGSSVVVFVDGQGGSVLHERKRCLRFARAVMGADGLMAVDTAPGRCWSSAALDEELSHDADLDILSLFTLHAVRPDDREQVTWLHTHGLAEMGAFDFDILRPDERLVDLDCDILRLIGFRIVEGVLTIDRPVFSVAGDLPPVRLVPAEKFARRARKLVEQFCDETFYDFLQDRCVLCEPKRGWFGRPEPSRVLVGPLPDDFLLGFSGEATDLMTRRARGTFSVGAGLWREFAALEPAFLVKLKYAAPHWKAGSGEHLWFEVHETSEDAVEATLLNEPFRDLGMHQGDRARHELARMSDWKLLTPVGPISPRSMVVARIIRAHHDEIVADLRREGRSNHGQ